ncbi:MAG: hypothetical protein H6701_16800 [Myxococcales bacterium]|nr:hypothetical protein [Myxococcales bacterium]
MTWVAGSQNLTPPSKLERRTTALWSLLPWRTHTMAVTIQIDLEQLNDPAVAKALANLLLAMGGVATTQAKPVEAPAASQAPAAPAVEAPTPSAAPAAPKAPRTRAAAAPKAEVKAEAAPAAQAEAPKAEAPKAAPAAGDDDLAQRYRDFVANLPERSRKFLELVQRKGVVTIEDAMSELDIAVPKAMGGITGSIGRWAPVRGVPVPYEATTRDGERIWRWLGSPIDGETAVAAPAAAAPKAEEAPKATKGRGKGKAPKKEKAPATGRKTRQAKAAAAEPAPAAPAASDDSEAAGRFREFVANLPERSQRFIELVRERGKLTINEAMDALGIDVPKAMGGITGSIGRWAPVRGVPIPYKATTIEGERAWEWVGGPGTGKAGGSPKAEAPAGVTPSAAAPEGAKQQPVQKTEVKNEQSIAPDPAKVDALIEALPERSALFLRTLRQRGVLTMPEVLERFSLAKARAVGGIIDPIQRAAEQIGMEVPFIATFAPTGDKAWLWPGNDIRRAEPEQPTLPTFEAVPNAAAAAEDEGDDDRGREAARPGVRVRRRGS